MNGHLHTYHHACGCISQVRTSPSARPHGHQVFCGNDTCPFDPFGTHRKRKSVPGDT